MPVPRTITITITAAAVLGCLLAAAPTAQAADGQAQPGALGTDLRYDTTTWTGGGEEMSVMAPRGWRFVVTPEGQARFNAPDRPDVLVMDYRGDGPLREQLRDKVASLQGTPGLKVLRARVDGRGTGTGGELRYLWTPPGGETRFVDYRYQGDDVYVVAGRLVDRRGLQAVLGTASDTGACGGG